jgi:hypothetical protein
MKMKADLNETRNREKQMWNVVNEKRDVRQKTKLLKSNSIIFPIEIKTTTKRKQRTSFD